MVALDLAIPDDPELERRAAHVRREDAALAHEASLEGAAAHARRVAGLDDADGVLLTGLDAEHAAVGLHDEGSAPQAFGPKRRAQVRKVLRDRRPDVCVEDGRDRALVLAEKG